MSPFGKRGSGGPESQGCFLPKGGTGLAAAPGCLTPTRPGRWGQGGPLGGTLSVLAPSTICFFVLIWLLNLSFSEMMAWQAGSCFYCSGSCHLAASL